MTDPWTRPATTANSGGSTLRTSAALLSSNCDEAFLVRAPAAALGEEMVHQQPDARGTDATGDPVSDLQGAACVAQLDRCGDPVQLDVRRAELGAVVVAAAADALFCGGCDSEVEVGASLIRAAATATPWKLYSLTSHGRVRRAGRWRDGARPPGSRHRVTRTSSGRRAAWAPEHL